MVRKIIIDCDPGVDDALALILAFHSPGIEVLAVSGVSGNVPLDMVWENMHRVLSLVRPYAKPFIARGAGRPLRGEPVFSFAFHGEDGLGGVAVPWSEEESSWAYFDGPAQQMIPALARRHPGEITLAAVGPLTNLALGLREDPEGMGLLKEVVVMGGAVRTAGNITPRAEFNFYVDPLAVDEVLRSGLPLTLVPLDVTHQVFLSPETMAGRVKPMGACFSEFVVAATAFDPEARRFRRGREVFHMHDPLAVAALVDPTLVRKEHLLLHIDTHEGPDYGHLYESADGFPVDVCLGVDAERFLDLFLSSLR
jgi:purine nucleosidase